MKISKRAEVIEPSLSRRLYNMAKNYDNVIDLTLGDPDVQSCEAIKKAPESCVGIRDNQTKSKGEREMKKILRLRGNLT